MDSTDTRDAEPSDMVLLDVKGLNCPMPLLKAKKALNGMEPGQHLKVIATDPGSERDFQTFSAQSGNELLEFEQDDGVFTYVLRKKS
jgi:tRNA 2-thiouridine synthesizing protein A